MQARRLPQTRMPSTTYSFPHISRRYRLISSRPDIETPQKYLGTYTLLLWTSILCMYLPTYSVTATIKNWKHVMWPSQSIAQELTVKPSRSYSFISKAKTRIIHRNGSYIGMDQEHLASYLQSSSVDVQYLWRRSSVLWTRARALGNRITSYVPGQVNDGQWMGSGFTSPHNSHVSAPLCRKYLYYNHRLKSCVWFWSSNSLGILLLIIQYQQVLFIPGLAG